MDPKTILLVLATLLVAIGVTFFTHSAEAEVSGDGQVIAQLKKAGSNLAEPHPIEFFFYFPAQAAADRVAVKLRVLGFTVKDDRAAKGPTWLLLATKSMIPNESELVGLRKDFDVLANAEKGEYDGWGTPIVK